MPVRTALLPTGGGQLAPVQPPRPLETGTGGLPVAAELPPVPTGVGTPTMLDAQVLTEPDPGALGTLEGAPTGTTGTMLGALPGALPGALLGAMGTAGMIVLAGELPGALLGDPAGAIGTAGTTGEEGATGTPVCWPAGKEVRTTSVVTRAGQLVMSAAQLVMV